RDTDDLGALFGQHLAVIRVGVLGLEPFRGRRAALGVRVGHRYDLYILDRLPNDIESVAIVPPAGSPNHGDAISLCHASILLAKSGQPILHVTRPNRTTIFLCGSLLK